MAWLKKHWEFVLIIGIILLLLTPFYTVCSEIIKLTTLHINDIYTLLIAFIIDVCVITLIFKPKHKKIDNN